MKRFLLFTGLLVAIGNVSGQQIGDGFALGSNNFSDVLNSGVYNGLNMVDGVPDASHSWQYLFVMRHYNTTNNYQLQIASTFAENDRLFFRKIANSSLLPKSTTWFELATRGSNNFVGNQYIDGNVGIGITNPTVKLEILGNEFNQETTDKIIALRLFNKYTVPSRDFKNSTVDFVISRWEAGGDHRPETQLDIRLSGNANNTYDWHTPNIDVLTLRSNGNVGVGTTNPTEKLTVKGTILASKVQIVNDSEIPASDYVFNSDYKLRSLQEVEAFVTENKHLPEVPSAAEFKENGYSIGEMDDLLLRKVEELTLYIIEQEKKHTEKDILIEKLIERIDALEQK